MRRTAFLTTLVAFLQLTAGFSPAQQPLGEFEPAKIEVAKPPDPKNDAVNVLYVGSVTEVTKNSITIRWPGEKPKQFVVSDILVAGEIPKEPRLSTTRRQPYFVDAEFRYRLADVKVGDQVMIRFARLGTVNICDHICIDKRPGGLVPALPDGANAASRLPPCWPKDVVHPAMFQYHEWRNAYWDLVDKGIPYPEKFGPYRRWPVAPMPRALKLTTPTIAP